MHHKRKVLFLVTDDWYFLSHRLNLARHIYSLGASVTVVTGCSSASASRAIQAEDFELIPIRFARSARRQISNYLLIGKLVSIFSHVAPDVVHNVSFFPVVFGSIAAERVGVPCVVNAITGLGHAFSDSSSGNRFLRKLMSAGYKRAFRSDRTNGIFQNQEDLAYFVSRGLCPRERCTYIPGSGVDVKQFVETPQPNNVPPIFLHASRILRSKGIEDSIAASARLLSWGIEHELIIAGRTHPDNPAALTDGQIRAAVKGSAARWIGPVENMVALLAIVDVVLLPTRYREGVPMILLEAAASGRPIITSNLPGCRDIVRPAMNGFLIPPGSVDCLSIAMADLAGSSRLRKTMGAASRQRVCDGFTMELVNERTWELYMRGLE